LIRTLKLTIEYDGTDYGGWQRQENAPTVQAELEDRLRVMTGDPGLALRGAGRTDSGVHALGQVCSFRTTSEIPAIGFLRGVNSTLPKDIGIMSAEDVPADFDARRSARGKLYRYRVLCAPTRAPQRERFVWHVRKALDPARMQAAAGALVGRHDFRAFRAADCERDNTVRTLWRVDVTPREDEIVIEVEGDAFLKNMVRVIAGTLVGAGKGDFTAEDVARIRDGCDRTRAGMTAPPQGLCLVRVMYA
jgi:tRNA pseudouridine38-40 synthase